MICDDVDWKSPYILNQHALKNKGKKKKLESTFGPHIFDWECRETTIGNLL